MLYSRRYSEQQGTHDDTEAQRVDRVDRLPARPTGAAGTRALVTLVALAATAWILLTLLSHSTAWHHGHSHHHDVLGIKQAHSAATHLKVKAQLGAGDATGAAACHSEEHAEYEGDLVKWGSDNMQETAEACCESCRRAHGCNVWVWCPDPAGCTNKRAHKECWLKEQRALNPLDVRGSRHPSVRWTSGALYDDRERQRLEQAEAARLASLRDDPGMPLVWLDVSIKGHPLGKLLIVLFSREAPRAAENFRALCTGEKGTVPEGHEGAGLQYHLKGKPFYRIIDRFIDQTGAGTDSVFGGYFADDLGGLALKHDRKGLLSMANSGHDQNSSHFSILMGPAPHLDGHYTIFGEVVEGFHVAEAINALARGQPENFMGPEGGAVITNSGQLRCGNLCPGSSLQRSFAAGGAAARHLAAAL